MKILAIETSTDFGTCALWQDGVVEQRICLPGRPHSETLFSFDTYQFDDYSKMVADRFDANKKAKRRKEIFPIDCKKAFDMGARMGK